MQQIKAGEYYGLILFATVGMVLMSSAIELVLIFIALEISSISTYILAGFRRRAAESAEASLKYFLLGSFATAFFLYGVAMVFGSTGSTNIYVIAEILKTHQSVLTYLAVALDVCRTRFQNRLGSLPRLDSGRVRGLAGASCGIHVHRPESGRVRRALARAFRHRRSWMVLDGLGLSRAVNVDWQHWRAGAEQRQAPAGLFLDRSRRICSCGLCGRQNMGISAAMFYAASYAAMNVGAFAIVAHLSGKGEKYVTLEDYAGLGRRSPLIASMLTIFLLSLIGIPITGGFFAKFYVFSAAMHSNLVVLTIIGVINSAIAAYYYLRIIVYMYMRDERAVEAPVAAIPFSLGSWTNHQPDRRDLPRCASQPCAGLRHPRRARPIEVERNALQIPASQ